MSEFHQRVRYIGVPIGHLKDSLRYAQGLVIEIDRDERAHWQGKVVAVLPDRAGLSEQRIAQAIEGEQRSYSKPARQAGD